MEKIIEWKNEIQKKIKSKLLENLKPSFKSILFFKSLFCIILALFPYIQICLLSGGITINLTIFLLSLLGLIPATIVYLILNIKETYEFETNKSKVFKKLDNFFENNESFFNLKNYVKDYYFKNSEMNLDLKIENEELDNLIQVLTPQQKEIFKKHLSENSLDNILNYNVIITGINILLNDEQKKQKEKELEKKFQFKNEDLKELEANSSNLNIRNIL